MASQETRPSYPDWFPHTEKHPTKEGRDYAVAWGSETRYRRASTPPAMIRLLPRTALVLLAVGALISLLRAQPDRIAVDQGAAGTWHALQKLRTFASVLHTTAHPDDEHGGVLTWLSRGLGAHVSLLTLTRGESGDNALGSELFDALGLIRTEELLAANRYYGVDRQYFTSAIDYGYSKRVSEAWNQWSRTKVLEQVVRVIRKDRPLVVVSRFQGEPRDGHGQHIAAGEITREAFHAAADPDRFPQHWTSDGLRPWQARRLYAGGVRNDEPAAVAIDVTQYSPWLGRSYRQIARLGLSLQRSQNAGRSSATPGSAVRRYQQLWPLPGSSEATHPSFFKDLQTDWGSLASLAGTPDSPELIAQGRTVGAQVEAAVAAFTMQQPTDSVPALAAGLRTTRALLTNLAPEADAAFLLRTKVQQFEQALRAALGLNLVALAVPPHTASGTPTTLAAVVPGQTIAIDLTLEGSNLAYLSDVDLQIARPPDWQVVPETEARRASDRTIVRRIRTTIGADTKLSRPAFSRTSLTQHHYTRAEPAVAAIAVATFRVEGVPVTIRTPVQRREARLPYGYVLRDLQVLPAVSLTVRPAVTIVPHEQETVTVTVEVERAGPATIAGTLALQAPPGWAVRPVRVSLASQPVDERFDFTLHRTDSSNTADTLTAVATLGNQTYREGYQAIAYRDLETRYLFRDAHSVLRDVAVTLPNPLTVGYVMGIGDEIPAAIRQLGARVQFLEGSDLDTEALDQLDAIIVGTRAYAVRPDLHQHNDRLLEYAERGGHLIVLYNTQEFVPNRHAPFPAELPRRPEEVTEEDAAITILAPDHPVLHWPNRIDPNDFTGWVEQRGSKFLSAWDSAYTPIVSAHDLGQPAQQGGWLMASHGRGHYTYFAYALHRQLPFGVPGAYRILANLLSVRHASELRRPDIDGDAAPVPLAESEDTQQTPGHVAEYDGQPNVG